MILLVISTSQESEEGGGSRFMPSYSSRIRPLSIIQPNRVIRRRSEGCMVCSPGKQPFRARTPGVYSQPREDVNVSNRRRTRPRVQLRKTMTIHCNKNVSSIHTRPSTPKNPECTPTMLAPCRSAIIRERCSRLTTIIPCSQFEAPSMQLHARTSTGFFSSF